MAIGFPKVDSSYREAIASASKDVKALIDKEHCVPMLIRLAFNDGMTYDAATNTSGCNGSIRYELLPCDVSAISVLLSVRMSRPFPHPALLRISPTYTHDLHRSAQAPLCP